LLTIYGTRARDVVALAERDPSLREPLGGATPAIAAVIPFAFTHEHAQTLADALLRRTMIALAELQRFHDEIALQLPRGGIPAMASV
ncbi:MAG TPA: glycerol-3-phosphate dehydrogenase C-terminal domain-containing protein, partial [Thermomicrobiales bacterium]|nr:glycerol-3-phosphate dehydrogenase C-terminal domain-containing protein [Thermomicrobiales bacterium]